MSETIAVLFIFFVLIMFGIVFYYKYSQVQFKEKQQELLANRAMDLSLKVLFLPELQCSKGIAEKEDNCIDMEKLPYAAQVFRDKFEDYYFDMFGFAKITLFKAYPLPKEGEKEENWIVYDNPKKDYTQKESTFFVVALRSGLADGNMLYDYGYLQIEVYS